MKIVKFNLLAVGPFTGVELDLSAGEHGLHVILGPNEAGKSSSLRALRALLYGFPPQTSDNFLHENTRLRVGGTLRHSDGSELSIVRRKGNRDTLLNMDESPMDDRVLERFMGTVDLQQFTTFFGLGHQDLRDGGEQILKGGGKVGESLFAAGAGGLRLRRLLQDLETRADELYKPRGRNPKIAVKLVEHRDAIKVVGDLSLSVEEWSKHDADLAKAKDDVARIEREIEEIAARRNRLTRLGRSIPLLARRRAALEAIAILGDVPALAADFSESRRTASRSLAEAEEAIAALKQQISRIDDEIVQLDIPQELLGQGERIETLHGQLRSYQESLQQLPILHGRRDESLRDGQRILRGVRPDVPIDQVEVLRLSTARREQINALARDSEGLKQSLKLARKALADLEEEKRQNETELAEVPELRDPASLQSVLAAVQKRGQLEKRLADESSDLKRQIRRAEADLKKLGLWSGTIEEIETLALPSIESIELARQRQEKCQGERDKLAENLRQHDADTLDIDHQLEVLRAGGKIPTDAELQQAREHRQLGWALVRKSWLDGAAPADKVSKYAGGGSLADTYEQSVTQSDVIADALRAESDRVARQAALVMRRKLTEEKRRRERERLAEVDAAIAMALADWKSLWAGIGITPLSPREMSSWTARQRELAHAATVLREKRDAVAELEKEIAGSLDSIVAVLQEIGSPVTGEVSLAIAMAQGEKVIEQLRSESSERAKLLATLKKLDSKISTARENLSAAEKEHASWRTRWDASVAGLGVPQGADPAVAMKVVGDIDELFLRVETARAAANDIELRRSRMESFDRQAAELNSALSPHEKNLNGEQAAISLYGRLKKARDEATRRNGLTTRRREAFEALEQNQRRAQAAREAQAGLVRLAGCENIEQLPAVEDKHRALTQSHADLAQVNRELLLLCAGESIDELAEQSKALDADALPAQLAELAGQLERLKSSRTEAEQKIGGEKTTLSQMNGNARASEAAERAQELLAELRQDTEDYARLKLAAKILHRGIERYRQRKQGPLLGRAGAIFSRLTLGAFTGLQADYDENDKPVLVGARADARRLGVGEMSDGTRDQLYLALRLATLEDYLSRSEPIPFILDDILVNFDNDRSEATLKILAEVSKKTQVILFTHHAHIADLAARIDGGIYQTTLRPRELATIANLPGSNTAAAR